MPPDPPFLADSIAIIKVEKKKVLWPWFAVAGAFLLLIAAWFLWPVKNHTLTALAVQGTPPVPQAKLPIHLLDENGILKMAGQTDAKGIVSFKNVPNGSYALELSESHRRIYSKY